MEELVRIRVKRGLTQNELSKLSGVNQQTISRYEKGQRVPDSNNLKKLALALKCSADDLLGITEQVKKFKNIQKNIVSDILR